MPKRLLQIVLLCFVGLTMMRASSPDHRFDKLGHSLMCTCGCGQVLLECNHVGCPVSGPMIAELHNLLGGSGSGGGGNLAAVASGLSNTNILNWFAAKYGSVALASPIRGGFDLVAWIVPFAVLAMGIAGVVFLVRLWHGRHAGLATASSAASAPAVSDSVRDRIRRETTFEP